MNHGFLHQLIITIRDHNDQGRIYLALCVLTDKIALEVALCT